MIYSNIAFIGIDMDIVDDLYMFYNDHVDTDKVDFYQFCTAIVCAGLIKFTLDLKNGDNPLDHIKN